jgi:hypothetical protein
MGIGLKSKLNLFYILDTSDEPLLETLPWSEEEFDALIVIPRESAISKDSIHVIIAELVMRNTDWIDVIGLNSEWIHDEIDKTSVRLCRQKQIGDGSPMTGWNEDINEFNKMVEYVGDGGLGGNDNKAVILIGNPSDFAMFVEELKLYISKEDSQEDT